MVELGSEVDAVLGAGLPVGDWQFWAASLVTLVAAGWCLRGVVRMIRPKRQQRTSLTIGGERRKPRP